MKNKNIKYLFALSFIGMATLVRAQWSSTSPGGSTAQYLNSNALLSSGRLGVGTSSPNNLVHVRSTGSQLMRLESTVDAVNPVLELMDSSPLQGRMSAINFLDNTGNALGQVGYTTLTNIMNFRTNNTERMFIDGGGNLGLGISGAAGAQLHTSGTVRFNILGGVGFRMVVADASGNLSTQTIPASSLPSGTINQTLRHNGITWVASSALVNDGSNIGIGTTTPGRMLHIKSTGSQLFRVEAAVNGINPVLELMDNSPAQGGMGAINFLNSLGNARGQIGYVTSSNAMNFNTNGSTRMLIDANGNIGVGMTAGIWTGGGALISGAPPTNTQVKLDVNGLVRCNYLVVVSDEKLKTNVKAIESPLQKVLKLHGVTYDWNTNASRDRKLDGFKQIGFLAQEVLKVVPEAVGKDNEGLYGMNYIALIPLLTEAIKEQNATITELKAKLNELASSKTGVQHVASLSGSSNIELLQNRPNPFDHQTVVPFTLPESAVSAKLMVFDMQGKLLQEKEITQRGSGEVTLDADGFNPGMYLYSILVDGKETETKRMIIAR